MARNLERLERTLERRGGRSRSAHYQDIDDGLWTPPVRIGKRTVGWPSDETDRLVAARVAGLSDEEIRQLVRRLLYERKLVSPY